MNAIRRDETTDNIHSIFVDQWDWEKIITPQQRTMETLQATVRAIYLTLRKTEGFVCAHYPHIKPELPDDITFVSSQELEDLYPDLPPKEREYRAVREYGAVFLTGIGGALRSGQMHDGRAPDYDDWSLNGDILLYDPLLDIALEVSSMGIRVDPDALRRQLAIRGCEERAELPFQKALLNGELPQTMGGGIGQSRMCVYLLRKAHVGEVQASLWPLDVQEGKYSAAVSKAMGASLKCGLSPCFIIPYEIAPSCRDSRRCPICFILHDPPPKCFLTYACLCCCVTHAFLSEFAFC
jgi:aspartate--ammonia ligase